MRGIKKERGWYRTVWWRCGGGDPRFRSRAGREHQDEDEDEVEDVDEDDDLGQMSVLWSLQRLHEDPRPDVRAS